MKSLESIGKEILHWNKYAFELYRIVVGLIALGLTLGIVTLIMVVVHGIIESVGIESLLSAVLTFCFNLALGILILKTCYETGKDIVG